MTTQDKGTALITGASSGIGAVYADRLARRGYDLIIVARNRNRLDGLARRLTNETERSVEVLAADLNSKADLSRVEDALKKDSSITMLVNNAGMGTFAPLLDSDADKMDEMIFLNMTALTRLTYAVAPRFVARGTGTIINFSSVAGIAPEFLNGAYGGGKAYVLAFSLSLQHELAPKGIRIQAVLPGAISIRDAGGMPVSDLPSAIVMTADNLVDAALAGLDQRELVTIPALADKAAVGGASPALRLALAQRSEGRGQKGRSVKSTMCCPSSSQARPSLAVREHWLW
jgi:short-subunit dehydrogenase